MELCEKLKQIRKENNLTQQQLADELCLSRTVITKYEKGHSVPSLDTLILISNYFKTSIFDEYKDKFKLFFLSIKCIIPYLISLIILLCSSLTLITNTIKINHQYGYSIYNDELKVEKCEMILIVKKIYYNDDKFESNKYDIISKLYDSKNMNSIHIRCEYFNDLDVYYLFFINNSKNDCETSYEEGHYFKIYNIKYKPFIYPLKNYNESLPYNKQTGECSKILNYYIDLIEKVK